MLQQLPETADFIQQAKRNSCFEGSWPIARLDRVRDVLNRDSGELSARVEFGSNAGGDYLKGTVKAEMEILCVRCLQPMIHNVSCSFLFGLVTSKAAMEALPEDMEPCLVTGEEQSIIAILEDELLLSLPIVSVHQEVCSEYLAEHEKQKQADKEASSPFAVLKNFITD